MGGSSKSKTSEIKTTNVTTTTSTQMGDVGLTGGQMVDMAAVLESGGIEREKIAGDTIDNLVQATGNAWNRLIGGATDMVETAAKVSENIVNRTPVLPGEVTAEKAADPARIDINTYIPILGLGVIIVALGWAVMKGKTI